MIRENFANTKSHTCYGRKAVLIYTLRTTRASREIICVCDSACVSLCGEIQNSTTQGQSLRMRFSLVFSALLCFTTWMSTARATHGSVSNCCPRWSNTIERVSLEQIVDYKNQSAGVCPITAVVFVTKRGKRICSDPNSARTKRVILKLDKEKEKKEELPEKLQAEEGSASTIVPAVSSASKTAPQNTRRHGRRRQRKKSRRMRNWQRRRV